MTIPQVREWVAGSGVYQYGAGTRLVADSAELSATTSTVAEDLLALTGRRPLVVQAGAPASGDVFLTLVNDAALGDEGYRLIVGDAVRIEARTARGCFYGTRTLLQMLRKATTIPGGTIRDWPSYPERGLLIANELRTLPERWWQERIREMAYLKLNLLYFYVGYPLASIADMQKVAAYAAHYHVTVVPQLNMPGHMANITGHPQLPGRPQSLDLRGPQGIDFARRKLAELLPAFTTPSWHLGADEYMHRGDYADYPELLTRAHELFGDNATERDLVYDFVNNANAVVRAHDKWARIWNDDLFPNAVVRIDQSVTIEHWENFGVPAADLLAQGYKLQNCHRHQLYYNVGGDLALDPEEIYRDFRVGAFNGSKVDDNHAGLLGAKLHVWIDDITPVPDAEIAAHIFAPMRSIAQRTWDTVRPVKTYAEFAPRITQLGHAPGNEGWLSETAGLSGRAFVKGAEQHVLVAAGAAGGVLHWSYSDATGVVSDRWGGPVLQGQPIGFQHGEEHHAFGRAADGSLAHWQWTPGDANAPHFDNWLAGPGSLTSAPAALAYFDQQHVFYRNAAGGLTHRTYDRSSGEIHVEDWGGALEGNPVAYVWNDEQHVFGRGPDGSLRHWWYTPRQTTTPQRDTWTGPNTIASTPTGFAYADQQHVYYRTPANRLAHTYWDQSTNTITTEDWAGELIGDPVGYVWRDEQHVFARTPANALAHWYYTPTQTTTPARDLWTPPNTVTTDPTGYATPHQQHTFYRTPTATLGHRYWNARTNQLVTDDWPGTLPS
ncbi:hypothetical protein GCM10009534_25200 [Kribbella sandramycini]